jgi:hypothetical protein
LNVADVANHEHGQRLDSLAKVEFLLNKKFYLEAKNKVDLTMHSLDDAIFEGVFTDVPEDSEAAEEQAPVEEVHQCEQRNRPSHNFVLEKLEIKD